MVTYPYHLKRHLFRDCCLIFFFSLVLFLIGYRPEFIAFQTRFALFAQEMFRHGITFFPITYQGPYPDYTALPTIIIYGISLLFGKVTTLSAILPTTIASSLILVMIYLTGSVVKRTWGLYGVLFALLTQFFVDSARSISPDQYITLITLLCFYLAYTADIHQFRKRLWFLPVLLLIGFAFRGPIGLVIPTSVLCIYYLYNRAFKQLLITILVSCLLLGLGCLALIGAAYHQGGPLFIKAVFSLEAASRLAGESHFLDYWLYSFATYAIAYPIAIIVILTQLKTILKPTMPAHRLLGYLTLWLLIILLGMSIPGAKKVRYILPILPAIALLAAYIFISNQKGILMWVRKIFLGFCYIFPTLCALLTVFALFASQKIHPILNAYYISSLEILIVLTAMVWLTHHKLRHHVALKNIVIVSLAVLTLFTINIGILDPINYELERTQPFIQQMTILQTQKSKPIVFYKIGPDAEDIKFIVNWNQPINPEFIQSTAELLAYQKPAYLIAEVSDFKMLPQDKMQLLYRGKIGHRECVIFQKIDSVKLK